MTVHIVPKQGGQKISYKVSRSQLLTHGGVPIFGLYPDYLNTIRVDYTRIDTTGKRKSFQTNISSMRLLFTLSLQETPWSA